MFSLSPIPPTAPAKTIAPAMPAPFCGTPDLANFQELTTMQGFVKEGRAAMGSAVDALFPMMPMVALPGRGPRPNYVAGMLHAERGIAAIDQALAATTIRGGELVTALTSAAREARSGLHTLTLETKGITLDVGGMPDIERASTKFNAASTWLGIADDLIKLQLGATTNNAVA